MIRDLKAVFKLKEGSELTNLLIVVGSALVTVIMMVIFAKNDDEVSMEYLLPVAFGAGSAGYLSINLFLKAFMMADEIPRGLSFGMTRRKLFAYSRLFDLMEILILAVLVIVSLENIGAVLILKVAALCFGFFMWVEGVAGNNVIRYGKTAYWIFYVTVMVLLFALPKVISKVPAARDLAAKLFDGFTNSFYNQVPIWTGLIVFILSGLLVNWLTFRKMPVNYII